MASTLRCLYLSMFKMMDEDVMLWMLKAFWNNAIHNIVLKCLNEILVVLKKTE